MSSPLLPDAAKSQLLVIDLQQSMVSAMGRTAQEVLSLYPPRVMKAAGLLSIPAVVTEQYPKGLGPTLPEYLALLPGAPVLAKLSFSALANEAIARAIEGNGRPQVVVMGIETHVCVYQSALDLLDLGYQVFVCRECVASRSTKNWAAGLDLMQQAGATLTSVESLLFAWMRGSDHPRFKAIQALIK